MDGKALALQYFERVLKKTSDEIEWGVLTADGTVRSLWPFNSFFQKDFAKLTSIPYDESQGTAVDAAIEHCVAADSLEPFDILPPTAKRVLLERHSQAVSVFSAIHPEDPTMVMAVPIAAGEHQRLLGAIAFLLHGMTLPLPAEGQILPEPRAGRIAEPSLKEQ